MRGLGNVLILGDSYSTFEGFNPKENRVWYNQGGHERTDVTKVEETWWHLLFKDTESNLVLNESFSGATVCNTERPIIPHTSFIYRLNNLIENKFFTENKIDTVFIFGGTNDSWIDSPIGKNKYEAWTKEDLEEVLPAFCYVVATIKKLLPNANVVAIVNTELKEEIAQGFQEAIEYFKITPIILKEISKLNGHPAVKGMSQIKDQILKAL